MSDYDPPTARQRAPVLWLPPMAGEHRKLIRLRMDGGFRMSFQRNGIAVSSAPPARSIYEKFARAA
jgi:hypothetical protein